ncbi:MAG: signal peptidase I [Ancrocorticia sp.]|nr:signal peptidase I [Ancrocorticia sp.]MCI1962543.1 signal peptidase I [Ancrocorticia sp.]MCI2002527.1 signal peptidase I [Ancrocorticia sp.]MCI2029685.1 signal peptidase I [Ancrocorticia sp.]MCI2178463.1 signal peptidase I [Ancrocorticia sp.]
MHRKAAAQETSGKSSWKRRASSVRYWVIIAILVALLWPIKWGGFFGSIVVSGHSMEPTYYTGDLLLIHKASPKAGQVMVYKVPEQENLQVVHRIRSGNSQDGWIFRGDNNTWDDPYTVPTSNLVGTPFLRIPSFGKLTSALASPLVIISLLVLAAGLLLWPRKEVHEEVEAAAQDDPGAAGESDEHATGEGTGETNSAIGPEPPNTSAEQAQRVGETPALCAKPAPAATSSAANPRRHRGRHASPPAQNN